MNGMTLSYKKVKEEYPESGRLDTRTKQPLAIFRKGLLSLLTGCG
jgi:hypothetical protein